MGIALHISVNGQLELVDTWVVTASRISAIGRTAVIGLLLAVVSCGQEAGQIAFEPSDRSLLSLAGDAAGTAGRFTMGDGAGAYFVSRHTVPTLTGRYWVTETGNVYTDFDIDTDLITSEIAGLAESMLGTDQSANLYRGSEYQVVFADLLSWVGITPPIDFTRQFNAAFEASGQQVEDPETLEPLLRPGCLPAREELEVAIGEWALGLDPEFEASGAGLEVWDVPLDELYSIPEFESMVAACTDSPPGSSETDDRHYVRVTREEADGAIRLVISVDRADYVGNDYDSALEILMTPDGGIGDPPDAPDPSGLLTTLGSYLVTISDCGELPYVRTEIFQVDYTGPDDPMYLGPSFFASGWVCEDDVPSD
jgi:hypothetical protein